MINCTSKESLPLWGRDMSFEFLFFSSILNLHFHNINYYENAIIIKKKNNNNNVKPGTRSLTYWANMNMT